MSFVLIMAIILSVSASLFFSTLTYSLRDFSRARLSEYLALNGKSRYLEPIVEQKSDLIFVTALARLVANVLVLLCMLRAFDNGERAWLAHYAMATAVTIVITLFCSVAIPYAASRDAAEGIIG